MKQTVAWLILAFTALLSLGEAAGAAQSTTLAHSVEPGDTWTALSLRYGVALTELKALNPHFNTTREPAIGTVVVLPDGAAERAGRLVRPGLEGMWPSAIRYNLPVWRVATLNGLESPYTPTLYRPLLLPAEGVIRELPSGIETLELSAPTGQAGRALGIRGTTTGEATIRAALDGLPVSLAAQDGRFAGVVGTGAFYTGKEPELVIIAGDGPAWSQPWRFAEREWEYQNLTLTGEAAAIDQQARDEERARLREIWSVVTPRPLWEGAFITPVETFLEVSANYGARRSYNGGPYLSYHEGVDYSAYGGTPVIAPAAGEVVVAEQLYVRGGAVILDHGLGIYSGFYHLSAVHATPGQMVQPGDLLGEVGTTGLSTGNHLHWDLLVNGIWIDAAAWQADGLDCWLLEGLGTPCAAAPPAD